MSEVEFGAPAFLWWFPLAGLPVAFHLLMKRRRKQVQFSSLLFLREADPYLNMKRKLKEILLLAARVLLILLLLLILSRPTLEGVPGLGQEVDVIVALDNSGSMDAPAGESATKLEEAKAAARRLVDQLNRGSRASVVPLVPDTGAERVPGFQSDPEKLQEQIDAVKPSEATALTGDFFDRVRLVTEGMTPGAGKVLHVFTDLHNATWEGEPGGAEELPEALDVVFNRISSPQREGANVSVESMRLPEGAVLPGHTYRVGGVLRNHGDREAEVSVRFRDSTGEKTGRRLTIPANSSRVERIPFTPEEAGDHWIILTIEGDSFRADNRGGGAIFCRTEGRVLLAGDRSAYGTVPTAISPTGEGRYTSLVTSFQPLEELMSDDREKVPLMVVMTWSDLVGLPDDGSERLREYLAGGGVLFVLPGVLQEQNVREGLPEWLGASAGKRTRPDEPLVTRILDPEGAGWNTLWDPDTDLPLRFFLVNQYLPLQLNDAYTGLAGPGGRRPIFATRSVGKGRVYVSGFALARSWTPLVTDPSGLVVVLLHRMATRSGSVLERVESRSAVAGERVDVSAEEADQLKVRSLVGDEVNATLNESDPFVFPRAGAFRVEDGERRIYVSVTGAAEESNESYITAESVSVMGEREHQVLESGKGEDVGDALQRHLAGWSLFAPLAFLALLVWALETWLATMFRKRSRAVKQQMNPKPGGSE